MNAFTPIDSGTLKLDDTQFFAVGEIPDLGQYNITEDCNSWNGMKEAVTEHLKRYGGRIRVIQIDFDPDDNWLEHVSDVTLDVLDEIEGEAEYEATEAKLNTAHVRQETHGWEQAR